eukprot:5530059-Alexandrium_andersonii.AAC.1
MAAVPRHGGGHRTVRGWSGRRRPGRHAGPSCGRHGGRAEALAAPLTPAGVAACLRPHPVVADEGVRGAGRWPQSGRGWGDPCDDGRTHTGQGRDCALAGVDGALSLIHISEPTRLALI